MPIRMKLGPVRELNIFKLWSTKGPEGNSELEVLRCFHVGRALPVTEENCGVSMEKKSSEGVRQKGLG